MNDLDQTLKRLLDAEKRAQRLVDEAQVEHERILDEARETARADVRRFEEKMADLRASLEAQAGEEADRHIAELERRFDERREELEALAEEYREAALEAAMAIVVANGRHRP